MAYKNRRYNGVMTLTTITADVVTTLDTSVIGANKVFSVDVLISVIGGTSIYEGSVIARYITLYYTGASGNVFLVDPTTIVYFLGDANSTQTWTYSEVINGSDDIEITVDSTTIASTRCIFDITVEYY
jgi:hypothetical protein